MRASFGGSSGDLGSFFAGLQHQQEAQAKADAKQAEYDAKIAKQEADAKQAADDQDAFDQWKNGVSSDADLLSYIANRVANTTDPTEHEKWVKYQREYTQQISDNQADYQYKSGQISAAQYVAYQKGVMASLDKGSQAWRDRALVVNQFINSQAENDLAQRAQAIIDGIPSGKSTYKDLLGAYQGALKTITDPAFKDKIQAEIEKTKVTIDQQAAQGRLQQIDYQFKSNAITGKQAGAAIRAVADQYFKGDQKTYYNVLDSALGYEKYPSTLQAGTKGTGGSGGGGRRTGGGGTAAATKLSASQKSAIDVNRANIARIVAITNDYAKHNGIGPITDPMTGKPLPTDANGNVDIRLIHQIQLQAVASYDHLTATYNAVGKHQNAMDAQKAKSQFISGPVRAINTVPQAIQTQHLVQSVQAGLAAAAQLNDPNATLQAAQHFKDVIDAYTSNLQYTAAPVSAPLLDGLHSEPTTTGAPKPLTSAVDPKLISQLQAMSQVLAITSTPNGDGAQDPAHSARLAAAMAYATKAGGAYVPASQLAKIAQTVEPQTIFVERLQSGTAQYLVGPDGVQIVPTKQTFSPIIDPTTNQPTGQYGYVSEPDLSGVKDAQGRSLASAATGAKAMPGMFDLNGRPVPALYLTYPDIRSPLTQWVARENLVLQKGSAKDGSDTIAVKNGQPIPESALQFIQHAAPLRLATDSIATNPAALSGQWNVQDRWNAAVKSGAVVQQPVNLGWRVAFVGGYTDETTGKTYAPQTLYTDPKLGVWTTHPQDLLPVVDKHADGTVVIDPQTLAPANMYYKPHSTVGMMPYPYVGGRPDLAQQVYNANPNPDAKMVDEFGNISSAPPDYYSTSYYDPALEAQRLAQQNLSTTGADYSADPSSTPTSNWFSRDIQNMKASNANQAAQLALRTQQQMADAAQQQKQRTATDSFATSGLASFGTQVGVKIGGPSQDIATNSGGLPKPPSTTASKLLPPIQQPINTVKTFTAPPPSALPTVKAPGSDGLPSLQSTTSAQIKLPTAPPVAGSPVKPPATKSMPSQDLTGQMKPPPLPTISAPKATPSGPGNTGARAA